MERGRAIPPRQHFGDVGDFWWLDVGLQTGASLYVLSADAPKPPTLYVPDRDAPGGYREQACVPPRRRLGFLP